MNITGDLPIWAVLLVCLLVAAILTVQNVGWLLSARAMLRRQRRNGGFAPEAPAAEPEDRTHGSER
jgi:hypothetical protein